MSDEESFVILSNCSPMHSYAESQEYSMERIRMPQLEEQKDSTTAVPEMTEILTKVTNSLADMELSGETVKDIQTSSVSSNDGQKMVCSGETVKDIQTSSGSSNVGQETVKDIKTSSVTANNIGRDMVCSSGTVTSIGQDINRSIEISRSIQTNSIDISDGQGAVGRSDGTDKFMQASSSNGQFPSVNKSLAASFILGEIPANVLKSSVYSQFPSLCNSMQSCPEEFVKLQCFWDQYIQFRDVSTKLNSITKQLQSQVVDLRNQNLELKRHVDSNIEQTQICEKIRQTDHTELLQILSEKTSQISNMQSHIEKLQQQQLASYEFVSKHENDNKQDYVERLEHQRIIKDMDSKMSKLLADNLSSKDMENQYIDEINCLKVNLTAAEELINQSRADINLLKAKDIEKSEEIILLRQQIDVYSKDFEMERNARQSIAGEKDQLLQDLRALQRKNQELIEETQTQWEKIEKRAANAAQIKTGPSASVNAAITSAASYNRSSPQRPIRELPPPSSSSNAPSSDTLSSNHNIHRCPVCFKTYKSLSLLQSHVNMCLDGKRD